MGHIWDAPLAHIARSVRQKELSVTELVAHALARIDTVDRRVRAFLTVDGDGALARARLLDAQGTDGVLAGLPMAIKDNISTRGIKTTCASKMLEHFVPAYDATVVARLADAGTVLLGKLNMDEFAMGGSNENSAFFPTHNPWDVTCVPGGSSGGSAAAVAAGEVLFALGSDTGGSIRQPAAYCGVVGLKPTYGLISRYGLVSFASSLDVIGPLTRTVEDAALVLGVLAGHDARDATSASITPPSYVEALTGDIRGVRIALPREYVAEGIDPDVRDAVFAARAVFERLGAHIDEVSMPHNEYAVATYYIVASSEASSNLARYDGVRYGMRVDDAQGLQDMYTRTRSVAFGEEVQRRIMLGTYALSSGFERAFYGQAQKVRTLIAQDFRAVFDQYDIIIGPTAPTAAFAMGAHTSDPLTMYLNDTYSIPMSLAGVPALSLPCGADARGMPVGLQVIGKPFAEVDVLRVAHAFEQATTHHLRRPALRDAYAAKEADA